MSDTDLWTIVIAGYAAIISTGALFLEVRRWFETGPRIEFSIMPEALLIGSYWESENTYLAITVTNKGTSPTTITHMVVRQFANRWSKFRGKCKLAAIVPNTAPHGGRELPVRLDVGEVWHGQAIYDKELAERALTGELWVGVACSHTAREILQRVILSEDTKLRKKFNLG